MPLTFDEAKRMDFRLEPPEAKPLYICPECRQPIYEGDRIVECDGVVHEECILAWLGLAIKEAAKDV